MIKIGDEEYIIPILIIVVVFPAIKGNAPQIPQAKKPNTNNFGSSFL